MKIEIVIIYNAFGIPSDNILYHKGDTTVGILMKTF
jgi:hypothetical protein